MHPAYKPRPPPPDPSKKPDFGDVDHDDLRRGRLGYLAGKYADKWIYHNRHHIWGAAKTYGPMIWRALQSREAQNFMRMLDI